MSDKIFGKATNDAIKNIVINIIYKERKTIQNITLFAIK